MDEPIVVIRQPGRQPLYLQVHGRLEMGRDCDGLLLADPQVSRRHAEVRVTGNRVTIVDLGSTNGTFVDTTAASEPIELRAGVIARLGGTTVEVVTVSVSAAAGVRATTILGRESAAGPADDLRRTSIDLVAESTTAQEWMPAVEPADGGTVTIVFSDIESSTVLATSMGDQAWYEVLEAHNRAVRQQVDRFGGFEVKSQGDGFMLTFPSARRAVRFAIATQRSLDRHLQADATHGVRVRMGMHTGEAIVDRSGDLFGRHVIVAARVANLAAGGEILVSSLVHEIVAARGDIAFGPPRTVELKGIEGEHRVHPVDWRDAEPPA